MTQKYYEEHTEDEAYNDVVEFAIQTGKISATLIQRRFRFGYNRAARMMDLLEERGVVGPQNGSKPRNVLINRQKQCETSYKMWRFRKNKRIIFTTNNKKSIIKMEVRNEEIYINTNCCFINIFNANR